MCLLRVILYEGLKWHAWRNARADLNQWRPTLWLNHEGVF